MSSKNKSFQLFFTGIVFSILVYFINPLAFDIKANTVFAVAFLMIFLWITEALPMAVTAMLPIIIYGWLFFRISH